MRFEDFEEFNTSTSEIFKDQMIDTLRKSQPDADTLWKQRMDWNNPQTIENIAKNVTWNPFVKIWEKIMESALNEEDK